MRCRQESAHPGFEIFSTSTRPPSRILPKSSTETQPPLVREIVSGTSKRGKATPVDGLSLSPNIGSRPTRCRQCDKRAISSRYGGHLFCLRESFSDDPNQAVYALCETDEDFASTLMICLMCGRGSGDLGCMSSSSGRNTPSTRFHFARTQGLAC